MVAPSLSSPFQLRRPVYTGYSMAYLLPQHHGLVADIAHIQKLGSSSENKALLELRLIAKNTENTPLMRLEAIKQLVSFLNRTDINIPKLDYQSSICVLKLLVDSSEPKAIVEEALKGLSELEVK